MRKLRSDATDLKTWCLKNNRRDLLLDWDDAKNLEGPENYSCRSPKKAFWKCHVCGNGWEAKIGNRTFGRNCPYCSNHKIKIGFNDLATTHPNIAKEWDYKKNYPLKPTDVTHGMGKKVWWICPHGHSYPATLLHRTSGEGTNCPICNSGRQTSFREQALLYYLRKYYPNIISRYKPDWLGKFELDIYIPEKRLAIEYDGAAWHKKEKFERERRKYQLCKQHGIRLMRIKEKMPPNPFELADEMMSIDNVEETGKFEQLLREVVRRVTMWEHKTRMDFINPGDVNLDRDRYEILKFATEVKGSLAELRPDIAKEWHPTKNHDLLPTMVKPGSEHKVWWKCSKCGNEWESRVYSRCSKTGTGCPKCAPQKQIEQRRINDVKKRGCITDPLLIKEWDYEKNFPKTPQDFTKKSDYKAWWVCSKCGYSWPAKIHNRSNGKGCPRCINHVVTYGINDLETWCKKNNREILIKEWDYEKNGNLNPRNVGPGSNRKIWWKCSKCGYNYAAPIARRTHGSSCRKCADRANRKTKN